MRADPPPPGEGKKHRRYCNNFVITELDPVIHLTKMDARIKVLG
jgi:hypothetical protein